jgi:glycosyltransferase involved in cell wall biosynthesis
MKVSIITVSFNSAATIGETLKSVSMQNHPDIEHIVIDGGSDDDTRALVKQHGSHVAALVSEPDRGIYDAMNKGIRLATGNAIGFLNADDVYQDHNVISLVARIMESGELDAVFGDAVFFRPEAPEKEIRRYSSKRFSPERIAWGWMPAHPTLFVRREVFARVGPFSSDYRIAGDFEFVARAFRQPLRYQYIPQVLVRMRTGGISTSGWKSTLLLNREVLRACRENGIRTSWFRILSKYPAKLLEFFRPGS